MPAATDRLEFAPPPQPGAVRGLRAGGPGARAADARPHLGHQLEPRVRKHRRRSRALGRRPAAGRAPRRPRRRRGPGPAAAHHPGSAAATRLRCQGRTRAIARSRPTSRWSRKRRSRNRPSADRKSWSARRSSRRERNRRSRRSSKPARRRKLQEARTRRAQGRRRKETQGRTGQGRQGQGPAAGRSEAAGRDAPGEPATACRAWRAPTGAAGCNRHRHALVRPLGQLRRPDPGPRQAQHRLHRRRFGQPEGGSRGAHGARRHHRQPPTGQVQRRQVLGRSRAAGAGQDRSAAARRRRPHPHAPDHRVPAQDADAVYS